MSVPEFDFFSFSRISLTKALYLFTTSSSFSLEPDKYQNITKYFQGSNNKITFDYKH